MATGDGINVSGSYATVQASAVVADGVMSAGAVTDIATAIPNEAAYFLLDFKVIVTAGTGGNAIHIYKRSGGDQPAPTATYEQTYVGSATLDTQTGSYYLRGVVNDDPTDTYYGQNATGASATFSIEARGRTYRTQA